jgi:anti-sigma B factor antagonist/stage II sporulation protein AA (anti-sigma F factor antagonist)
VPDASERRLPHSAILRPAGRIDLSNAEPFKEALLEAVATAKTAVILDLSGIEYVSSAGLRSLMIASKTAKPRGVALGVAALRPVVKEIFTISRFDLVVPCFDTVRDAVAKLDPAALASFDAG